MSQKTIPVTARNHILFWGGAFIFVLAFAWLFSAPLTPFILGTAVAYLLDPMVECLARWKVSRSLASVLILGLFFFIVFGLLAIIIPILYNQIGDLAEAMPDIIDNITAKAEPYMGWIEAHIGQSEIENFQTLMKDNMGNALQVSSNVLEGLALGGQAVAGVVSIFVITPIVAFFMMREWPQMTDWVDNLIPRDSYKTVKELIGEINTKVSGFVRGQLTVAAALAVIYAFALSIAGLKFGFLIGLLAGALSIIPLVGSTLGLIVSIVVAWFQSYELTYVGIIAAIFVVGQIVEGNFLTPKLLGKSVGLHPLWILFAIMAGGSLMGIAGMLLAVPVAAIAGVLISFGLKQYKNSPYYKKTKSTRKTSTTKKKTAAKK